MACLCTVAAPSVHHGYAQASHGPAADFPTEETSDTRQDVEALCALVREHYVYFAPRESVWEATCEAAKEAGVLCHVDACLGGFLLPFWERIGEDVPPCADAHVDGRAARIKRVF